MNRMRILVSACLLGAACRYDGASKGVDRVKELTEYAELIPFCPEIYGGLKTPREPAERRGECVVTKSGEDVTPQYRRGAEEALRIAKFLDVNFALLKEKSPSCGSGIIHNGLFDGGLIEGDGMTTELLRKNDITVWGESQIDMLLNYLKEGNSNDQI